MRKYTILNILFAICLTTNGQQVSKLNNHYRNGDVLEKKPSWDYLLDFF